MWSALAAKIYIVTKRISNIREYEQMHLSIVINKGNGTKKDIMTTGKKRMQVERNYT
jgi:hypothetical protein